MPQRLDRLERVTDLLLVLLDTSRPLSLREIADRVPGYPDTHGARRQAFERDKRLLRDEGIPGAWWCRSAGRISSGTGSTPTPTILPDLGLEPEEQAALNLAVAGVHLGQPIGHDALMKLGAVRRIPAPAPPAPRWSISGRSTAWRRCPPCSTPSETVSGVEFDYRGERRHVDPAGLRFRHGFWYVVGLDRDRGEARTFRVDRIDGVPEVDAASSARLPDGFDVDLAFSREPWQFGEGEGVEVDVLVDRAEVGPGHRRARRRLGDRATRRRQPRGATDGYRPGRLRPVGPRPARPRRGDRTAGDACRGGGPVGCPGRFRWWPTVSGTLDTAGRLRRLLAVLAWLAQVGEAPIDEVAARFDLTPEALVTELEMAACCGVPPYTPDQLMEIMVTESTVSTRVGIALTRPPSPQPSRGVRPGRVGPGTAVRARQRRGRCPLPGAREARPRPRRRADRRGARRAGPVGSGG
jgi:predicted DNA-binding transcriptional regulator YafY